MSQFTSLGDRYDIGQVIGRGGMAEVYEGTDRRLGRRVAVKVLRTDLARDPVFLERFRREAQSAAGLNHPNIVAVYDTGEHDLAIGEATVTVPYIVMEYVDGVTLRHMLQNGPRILPERGLEIIAGVLAGLDYAHRNGIVHRDIKPANIMINAHGDAKVMDFGIARAISDAATSVTATSAVMGTAQYLSPEQARGEIADARSDIYAVGCVLYELLVGRPPFNGDTPVAIAYQHVNEKPVAPSTLDPSVSITLDTIALHSLAKSPSARYQTATEMRADVERAMAGMPINANLPIDITDAPTQMISPSPISTSAPTQAMPVISQATSPIAAVSTATAEPAKKRSTGGLIGGSVAVIVAVLVIIFGGSQLLGGGGNTVTVPKLSGKTVEEAQIALENVGLILGEQTPAPDDTAPKGTIISQDPAAEELIEKGQAINVVVSAGPELTTVPDLVNLTSSELASDSLKQAGLVLGKVTVEDSDKPEGTVISQNPLANDSIALGTRVDIVVSSGKTPMPDVVGLTKTQAKNDLMNAGFNVDFITEETADAPDNTVIAQSPKAGELVLKGSTVTVTIAKAPAPSPTPTPTPTPSAT